MNEFYRELEVPIIRERMERLAQNRPDNLHDYQGCAAEQPKKRSSDESTTDVCMVRPVDRSVLGQEESSPVSLPVSNGCTGDRLEQARAAEQQPEHVLEIESRHSDYGQDAGGYAVLRFDGEWIGRCDDREAAAKLIAYVAALKAGKK
jgi:hypothetical protein